MTYVLDASAVLAWILREPDAEQVRRLMQTGDCLISSVNAAEIVTRLTDGARPEASLRQVIAHIEAACVRPAP